MRGPQDLGGYGTIAGRRMLPNPQLIEVTAIVEKPSVEYARTHLRVDGLESDRYLGWFGMHLLAPSIFEVLAEMIRDDVRDAGEFQLTRAQEIQRSRDGYFAVMTSALRRSGLQASRLSRARESERILLPPHALLCDATDVICRTGTPAPVPAGAPRRPPCGPRPHRSLQEASSCPGLRS